MFKLCNFEQKLLQIFYNFTSLSFTFSSILKIFSH